MKRLSLQNKLLAQKSLKEDRHITLTVVSEELSIPLPTLHQVFKGDTPCKEFFEKLAKYFDLTEDQLKKKVQKEKESLSEPA